MAKSEKKSKWKRKFRAIKREKNKKKELLRLNNILSTLKPAETITDEVKNEPTNDENRKFFFNTLFCQ